MPVNYAQFLAGVPSPVDRVQEGVLFGQHQQDRRAAQQAAEQKAEQQRVLNSELRELSEKTDLSPDDILRFSIRNPQFAETFKGPMAQLNKEQKEVALSEATTIFAALHSGQTGKAVDILERKKTAAENSGDKEAADMANMMMQTIQFNPSAAKTVAGIYLAESLGPSKFEAMFSALNPEQKKVAGNFKTFQSKTNPDKTFALNMNDPEDVKFLSENKTNLIPAPTRQETGAAGAFASGGKAEMKELNILATGVNKFIRNIDRAVKSLKIEPASGQVIGDIAVFADNMAENLKSLSGQSGVSYDDVEKDLVDFSGLTEPIAGSTAEFNSAIIDAAYAKALIQNGSRPTETDYQNAYKSITGGSQNPKILIRNLKTSAKDLENDFRFRFRQSTGKNWKGSFDFRASDNLKFDFSKMTKEELEAIDMESLSPEELDAAEKRYGEL